MTSYHKFHICWSSIVYIAWILKRKRAYKIEMFIEWAKNTEEIEKEKDCCWFWICHSPLTSFWITQDNLFFILNHDKDNQIWKAISRKKGRKKERKNFCIWSYLFKYKENIHHPYSLEILAAHNCVYRLYWKSKDIAFSYQRSLYVIGFFHILSSSFNPA